MSKNTKNFVLPLLAVVAVIVVFILSSKKALVSAIGSNNLPLANYEVNNQFVIPISELTKDVKFFSLDDRGTDIEILTAIDKNGNPKATLNTCQNCMGSPKAYFIQEGDSVVCQNCGIGHKIETLGTAKRGCNPIPIDSLAIDGENISFEKSELLASADLFKTIVKE